MPQLDTIRELYARLVCKKRSDHGHLRPRRLFLESLESRNLLTTFTWQGGSGLWSDSGKWLDENGQQDIPGVGDDVVFRNAAAGTTVTVDGPVINVGTPVAPHMAVGVNNVTVTGGDWTFKLKEDLHVADSLVVSAKVAGGVAQDTSLSLADDPGGINDDLSVGSGGISILGAGDKYAQLVNQETPGAVDREIHTDGDLIVSGPEPSGEDPYTTGILAVDAKIQIDGKAIFAGANEQVSGNKYAFFGGRESSMTVDGELVLGEAGRAHVELNDTTINGHEVIRIAKGTDQNATTRVYVYSFSAISAPNDKLYVGQQGAPAFVGLGVKPDMTKDGYGQIDSEGVEFGAQSGNQPIVNMRIEGASSSWSAEYVEGGEWRGFKAHKGAKVNVTIGADVSNGLKGETEGFTDPQDGKKGASIHGGVVDSVKNIAGLYPANPDTITEEPPGSSVGNLTIKGDLEAASYAGFLGIEIQGTTPGTQHDQLIVTTNEEDEGGNVQLDSSVLDVRLLNSFQPNTAEYKYDTDFDWFSILTASGTIEGVFEKMIMPEGWTVVYDRDDSYDPEAYLVHQPWVGNGKNEVVLVKEEIVNPQIVDATQTPGNNFSLEYPLSWYDNPTLDPTPDTPAAAYDDSGNPDYLITGYDFSGWAEWEMDGLTPFQDYEVFVTWPDNLDPDNDLYILQGYFDEVMYDVFDGSSTLPMNPLPFVVDQSQRPPDLVYENLKWESLGTFVPSSNELRVRLIPPDPWTYDLHFRLADAVMVVPRGTSQSAASAPSGGGAAGQSPLLVSGTSSEGILANTFEAPSAAGQITPGDSGLHTATSGDVSGQTVISNAADWSALLGSEGIGAATPWLGTFLNQPNDEPILGQSSATLIEADSLGDGATTAAEPATQDRVLENWSPGFEDAIELENSDASETEDDSQISAIDAFMQAMAVTL